MAVLPTDPLALVGLGLIGATIGLLVFSDWPRAYVLGASAIVLFGLQFIDQAWMGARLGLQELALSTLGLEGGDWWAPVTYAFLHGSLFHLFGNLFILLTAGPALEESVGPTRFLIIYAIGALAAGGAGVGLSYYDPQLVSQVVPMVGSSGAIFAVLTAFAVRHPREKLPIPFWIILWLPSMVVLLVFLAMNIGYIFIDTNVAWYGHFAGFLAGLALAAGPMAGEIEPSAERVEARGYEHLAKSRRAREAVEHLEGIGPGEEDVARVWLDVLAEEADCPVCGQPLERNRMRLACPEGHDLDVAEEHRVDGGPR